MGTGSKTPLCSDLAQSLLRGRREKWGLKSYLSPCPCLEPQPGFQGLQTYFVTQSHLRLAKSCVGLVSCHHLLPNVSAHSRGPVGRAKALPQHHVSARFNVYKRRNEISGDFARLLSQWNHSFQTNSDKPDV